MLVFWKFCVRTKWMVPNPNKPPCIDLILTNLPICQIVNLRNYLPIN